MKTKRRREPTAEQKAAAQAKRAELIALSRRLKKAMEAGAFPNAEKLNDAILSTYQEQTGQTDFRSFQGWIDEGFQVKKGNPGFPIWGKPRRANAGEPEPAPDPNGGGDPDPSRTFRLFPIAHLWHAGQVEPLDPNRPRRERKPRTEPGPGEPRPEPRQPRERDPRRLDLAARLRMLADRMELEIDEKMNPSIANQNPTRRRHAIAESMREDGRRLQLAQTLLRAAADCHEGNGPAWIAELDSPPAPSLLTITTKAGAIDYARAWRKEILAAMERGGAQNAPRQDWRSKYRAALGDLIGAKYDGFFPTGDALAAQIAQMAELATGEPLEILEPSAGVGNLALAAAEKIGAGSKIWTVERVPRLSAVLDIIAEGMPDKVRNLGAGDFLAYEDGEFSEGPADFDRIIMNPPFERGQDMAHVQAAYSLLRPGGILVAITCANIQYRTDGEYPAFRDWLDSIGAEVEKAPEDAFKGTIRTTNVAAMIVKIQK